MKLLVVFICVVLVGLAASHLVSVVRRFEPDVFPDEVTWHTAVCKGARLVDLMRTTDEKAGTLIEQWKDRNPPSAKSEWQGDLKGKFVLSNTADALQSAAGSFLRGFS